MKRKLGWLAMGMMMSGTALGQLPNAAPTFRPSNVYGLPVFPTPPMYPYATPPMPGYGPQLPTPPMPGYGPQLPTPPYGRAPQFGPGQFPTAPGYVAPGFDPNQPLPIPVPPDPRIPLGQRPRTMPPADGGSSNGVPTEPYNVLPNDTLPKSLPGTVPGKDTQGRPIAVIATGPDEPYTSYEGRPYVAATKVDNTRTWLSANYIYWWVRGDGTEPLVTTGGAGLGILGNADTTILLGNGPIGPRQFAGAQATLGTWIDPERTTSFEIGGFWVGKKSMQYRFASDAGTPVLTQPVIIGGADAGLLIASPGGFNGSANVHTVMDFHSLELNVARNVCRYENWTLDYLFGARYLYLNEFLSLDQNITVLGGGAGTPFLGVPQPAGANFLFHDSFNMTNRFYGGTLGARVNWTCCRFDLGLGAKVSLGGTNHTAIIDGATTLVGAGTATGGSLAQPSNIGRFSTTCFSVVPEFNLSAGYQVTPNLRIQAGYNFIDWSGIVRAGQQIDRNIDLTQVPTSPIFVPGAVGAAPRYPNARTDFWAQGINVGIELKY